MDYRQISARVIIGSLAGLLFFSVDAVATLIRFLLHPAVAERAAAERAAAEAFFAMLLYLLLFVAAGALAGCMRAIRVRWLRFALIGAVAGAVVWRYLTATWALTARPASFVSPDMGIPGALLFGAGAGAFGGLLLLPIGWLRRLAHRGR